MTKEEKQIYLHSTSHILAQAVLELFPDAKLGIGPAIENGFYYDFDLEQKFSEEILIKIEKKMQEIIKSKIPFIKQELQKEEAIVLFKNLNQDYKVELLNEIEENRVTLYKQGNFIDLCKGPHISNTGEIKVFKLLNIAGAYWKGNENNKMLQRIYGTVWETQDELKNYLDLLESAKKRDHRRLGKELDLFSMHEEAGTGLVYWHPYGSIVRNVVENFWKKEHIKRDYQLVYIPHIAKLNLWKTSGHWEFYRENMYLPMKVDNQEYVVKPMNCPGHIMIYKTKIRSYRDLPIKYAELASVYRYEKTGVLHGLLRVRGFTQDDAHIFCTLDQVESELFKVMELVDYMLTTFGYKDYNIYLSTRPEKYAGTLENWKIATTALEKILKNKNLNFFMDEGAGVFYGPKIDIKIIDAIGREWQGPTIQFDFNLPERFNITYIGQDNQEHKTIMIHRTVLGSLERFIGCLIEHYAGAFPVWLAPVQVKVISITSSQNDYVEKIKQLLLDNNIRTEIDIDNEKLGFKIRKAQLQKIPYMLIIGEKEVSNNVVTLRLRTEKNLGQMTIEKFIERIKKEIKNKNLGGEEK